MKEEEIDKALSQENIIGSKSPWHINVVSSNLYYFK
jgi:hypothetical protein